MLDGVLFLHFNEDDDESHKVTKKNEAIDGRQPAWEDDDDEKERCMQHVKTNL